jgi:hypothetical protein
MKQNNDPQWIEDFDVMMNIPLSHAHYHSGYIINGFRFRVQSVDDVKATQHSGVIVKCDGIQTGCDGYYGKIKEIVEVSYSHDCRVVLFKCDWFDIFNSRYGVKVDKDTGFISLNKDHTILQASEPFTLACQVEQVFYMPDNSRNGWIVPIRTMSRDYYDIKHDKDPNFDSEAYQDVLQDGEIGHGAMDIDI